MDSIAYLTTKISMPKSSKLISIQDCTENIIENIGWNKWLFSVKTHIVFYLKIKT